MTNIFSFRNEGYIVNDLSSSKGIHPNTTLQLSFWETVSADNPILFNLGGAKACNTLKINGITVSTAQIDNLVIEYSANCTDCTSVSNKVRSLQLWR